MFNCNTCERFPSDRTGFGKNRWASLVFWLQLQALRERRCSTSHASNIQLWRHIIERELNRCSLPPSVSQFTTRRSGHSSVLVITLWTSTITAKTNLQAECSKRGEHIPDGIIFRPLCLLFFSPFPLSTITENSVCMTQRLYSNNWYLRASDETQTRLLFIPNRAVQNFPASSALKLKRVTEVWLWG